MILLLALATSGALAQNSKELHRKAEALIKSEHFAEAITIYDKLIATDASDALALRGRGFAYISLGDLQKGKRDYQSALAVNPECANCYAQLASIEVAEGNLPMALKLIDNAIDLDKKMGPSYYLRGQIRENMRNPEGALADYNAAVALSPNDPDYRTAQGLALLATGDTVRALKTINGAIALKPDYAASYFHRAHYYVASRKWDSALKDMGVALKLGMRTSTLYLTRGAIYANMGRNGEAIADDDSAIALDPNNIGAYYNRAMSRYQMEDMDGSCEDSRTALELTQKQNPNSPAIAEFQRAIEDHCDSTLISYYYQRGIAAYNRKDYQLATRFYDQGLGKFPGSPTLIMFHGNAELAMGNDRQALDDYNMTRANLDRSVEELAGNLHAQGEGESRSQLRARVLASLEETIFEARMGLGDLDSAMTAITMAITASESAGTGSMRGVLLGERGALLLMKGDNQEGLKDLERGLAVAPDNIELLMNQATAYLSMALSTQIRTHSLSFDLLASRGEGSPVTLQPSPGNVPHREYLAKAIESCDHAVRIDPKFAPAYLLRGYARMVSGEATFCDDLHQAEMLGAPEAGALLKERCR